MECSAPSDNNMPHSQQMTLKGGMAVTFPRTNRYPSSYKTKGSKEAISSGILKAFSLMTINFSGLSFPENMAGVPAASGEATSSGLPGPRPSPLHSLRLSLRAGSPPAPGH